MRCSINNGKLLLYYCRFYGGVIIHFAEKWTVYSQITIFVSKLVLPDNSKIDTFQEVTYRLDNGVSKSKSCQTVVKKTKLFLVKVL